LRPEEIADAVAWLFTVYGQIPAGQSAQLGSYADTMTATVTYSPSKHERLDGEKTGQ
jgi:hypothetical protein